MVGDKTVNAATGEIIDFDVTGYIAAYNAQWKRAAEGLRALSSRKTYGKSRSTCRRQTKSTASADRTWKECTPAPNVYEAGGLSSRDVRRALGRHVAGARQRRGGDRGGAIHGEAAGQGLAACCGGIQTFGRALSSNALMQSVQLAEMPAGAALIDHTHPAAHVVVVLDGAMLEDGRLYQAGDVRASAADDRHFLRFLSPTRCVVIEGATPTTDRPVRCVTRAPELARAMQRAAGRLDVVGEIAARLEALSLAEDRDVPEWLRELQQHCRRHGFIHARSVQAIASEAGVSREHLARSYQKHFGTSVSEAVRAERLKQAYDGIVGSDTALADIAARCAFADQSHMTRLFSAWIGVTPGALRSRRHAGITSVQDREPLPAVS
jgi:AraC-like DNA-binding protein